MHAARKHATFEPDFFKAADVKQSKKRTINTAFKLVKFFYRLIVRHPFKESIPSAVTNILAKSLKSNCFYAFVFSNVIANDPKINITCYLIAI